MKSSTSITDLHETTLLQIIIRLSNLKHMITCKLVSKLWCKLISSACIPRIISSSSSLEENNALLFNTKTCIASMLPFIPNDLLDCCNGFLLYVDSSCRHYYVCNPSTQECVSIPYEHGDVNCVRGTSALVFDPYYKIVHVSRGDRLAIHIYSSKTCEWVMRYVRLEAEIVGSDWSPRCVFFSGSVYQLSASGHMLVFGVSDNVGCQAIKLPKSVARGGTVGCLGESGGFLHYGLDRWDGHETKLRIWKFLEDMSSHQWILRHVICLQYFKEHPLCSVNRSFTFLTIYAFHPTSKKIFVGNDAGMFLYDLCTKSMEKICKLSKENKADGQYIVFPFEINMATLDAVSQGISKESEGQI
ncbi:hypothetical protein ACHQM5_027713 [Ranunculus cassubicifolius]